MFLKRSAKLLAVGTTVLTGGALLYNSRNSKKSTPVFAAGSDLKNAVCVIQGTPTFPNVSGTVTFTETSDGKCMIEAHLQNVPPGKHG